MSETPRTQSELTDYEHYADEDHGHGHGHEEECEAWYRNDLMIGPAGARAAGASQGPSALSEIESFDELASWAPDLETLSPSTFDLILQDGLALYRIMDAPGNGLDPAGFATEFPDLRPVVATGFAPHWGMSPGTAPLALTGHEFAELGDLSESPKHVAMIDSGYLEAGVDWLDARVVPSDSNYDAEQTLPDELAGHGLFVASIIVQQEPDTRVVIARVDNTPEERLQPGSLWPDHRVRFWNDEVQGFAADRRLQDELKMLDAVNRLIGTDIAFDALNISMGAYVCESSSAALAIRLAMRTWSTGPGSPIAAAAGNFTPCGQDCPPMEDYLPGWLAPEFNIRNVSCTIGDGQRLASYSNVGQPNHQTKAAGHMVAGLRGRQRPGGWAWGGTSFATAIVSAGLAHRKVPPASSQQSDYEASRSSRIESL